MIINLNDIPVLNDIYQYILNHLILFIVIFSLVGILIYSMISVFLNKLNKEMYGKTTWMAWVPIFREFLLGKLTIHFIVGIILVLGLFCSVSVTIVTNGISESYAILPDNIREPFTIIYGALWIALYVFAHIKLANIRASGKGYSSKLYGNSGVITEYDKKYSTQPIGNQQNTPEDNFYGPSELKNEIQPRTLKEVCGNNKIDNNVKKP